MEDHHNGVNSTEELETLLSDYGVLFREYRGDGFMVVGEENIFIVKDHETENKDDGVEFSEVQTDHINELHAEKSLPNCRFSNKDNAEKIDNGNQKPATEISLYISNHTILFYTNAPIHKVSAAFVNFRTDD